MFFKDLLILCTHCFACMSVVTTRGCQMGSGTAVTDGCAGDGAWVPWKSSWCSRPLAIPSASAVSVKEALVGVWWRLTGVPCTLA